MEARFPTQDTVQAALIDLLRARGYEHLDGCVDVRLLPNNGRPVYRVTPDSGAVSLLATELASITGRALNREVPWLLLQSDVNLVFGAVRDRTGSRTRPH
jgi:hypothetical protein